MQYTAIFSAVKMTFQTKKCDIFSSPEPKAHQVSLYYSHDPASLRRSFVRCCRQQFETSSSPVKAKFYVEPPWMGGTNVCSQHLGHKKKSDIFSSPEPKAHQVSLYYSHDPASLLRPFVRCCRQQFETSFSPVKAKFYVEPPWMGGTNVCSQHLGHMTKMATTPIYGKNPSKSSL